ncbi:hypothetical protein BaRGS_00007696 [Batillaria attramentaria]|uniref:C-type lectin domain-containing protein n=1 Tax=Batillaria attramentaria TaxID=370345 RepID=A0ABD0LPZ1_9CAEN
MDLVTVSARTQLVALLLKIVVCTVELASSVDVGLCSNNGTMDNGQTVLLDGRCYALVKVEDKISWEDANIACLELGGYLASLNTEDEWDSVTNFIRGRSSGKPPVFVGLKLASPVLPNM